MTRILWVGLMILWLPAAATAQPGVRLGAFGGLEHANITEDDGFLGEGLGWNGGLELWLTERTALEIEVGRERNVRNLQSGERWQGTATYLVGLVYWYWGDFDCNT